MLQPHTKTKETSTNCCPGENTQERGAEASLTDSITTTCSVCLLLKSVSEKCPPKTAGATARLKSGICYCFGVFQVLTNHNTDLDSHSWKCSTLIRCSASLWGQPRCLCPGTELAFLSLPLLETEA